MPAEAKKPRRGVGGERSSCVLGEHVKFFFDRTHFCVLLMTHEDGRRFLFFAEIVLVNSYVFLVPAFQLFVRGTDARVSAEISLGSTLHGNDFGSCRFRSCRLRAAA